MSGVPAGRPPRRIGTQAARATALAVLGCGGALLTWRLRPAAPSASGPPDAAIVLGCAWLAWALIGYLAVSVTATAISHLTGAIGVGTAGLSRISPARVRRVVDRVITVGVATTVLGLGAAGPALAGPHHGAAAVQGSPQLATVGVLDWPGLAATTPTSERTGTPVRAEHRPTAERSRHRTTRRASAEPYPASTAGAVVVVRPGESLWSIAAARLDHPSVATTAALCDRWYDANRREIGADPNLIYPGERLHAPASDPRPGARP